MPVPTHLWLLSLAALISMATGDVIHVSVLFRHGHRSPVQLLPSQNFTVDNTWRDGLGQLTNIGKQNEFELGQFLRKRYGALLGGRYNSSDHLARSTDVDRTLMSAQACLAGLFPPQGDQLWNPALPWQPIPVHTRPQSEDWLLAAPEYLCPERDRQFGAMRADPRRLAFYAPFKDFLVRLSNGSGMTVTPDNVHTVLDILWINSVANLSQPAWLSAPADWQQLWTVGTYQWREYSWTPDLTRFGSGVLLNEILDTMSGLAAGRPPRLGRKLRLYSDHDTTVASTLAALGNADFVWPSFASCLMFELHRSAGSPDTQLRVWFRNDTARDPVLIPLPNCSDPCPLALAEQILGPMRLTRQQLLDRCQGTGAWSRWGGRWSLALLSGGLLLAAAVCCLAAGLVCCCCRRAGKPGGRSDVLYRSLADDVEG